jgi:hypothetical protein
MGRNEAVTATDSHARVHGPDNLFVNDASLGKPVGGEERDDPSPKVSFARTSVPGPVHALA